MAISIAPSVIFVRILMVFSLALFGVIARYTGIFRAEAKDSVIDIMLHIALPALILVSMTTDITWESLVSGIVLPFLSLTVILGMMVIANLFGRMNLVAKERRGTFAVLCSMPNTAFIGFPVIVSVLGEVGLAYAVLYDVGVTIAFCSVAILALQGGPIQKKHWLGLINPALISAVLGILLNWGQVQIPSVALVPLQTMGSATVPLAMLITGYLLCGVKKGSKVLSKDLILVCLCKLLVSPLLAYILMLPFDLSPTIRTVALMQAAMPSMASTPVLAEKFGGDGEFAVIALVVTTLLSMITLPVISMLAN
jgi:predicted permease